MRNKIIVLCLPIVVLLIFYGFAQQIDSDFEENIKVGISYYDTPNPTEQTDNKAIYYLQKAISSTKIDKSKAMKSVDAATKIGILHQTYLRYPEAIKSYSEALNIHQIYSTHDTTSYLANLYLGMIYYYSNDFIQCYSYLNEAEKIYQKYNLNKNSESLFNTLGVLYFESGNYRQSINYFTKAQDIELKTTGKKSNVALQSNLATALRHLGENQQALEIYQTILQENPAETRIKINLATTLLELKQPEKVFDELKSIEIGDDIKNQISYHNLLGRAYAQQKNYEAAKKAFNEAITVFHKSEKINENGKNIDIGNTFKYLGDIASEQKQWGEAMNDYQKSIFHTDTYFKESSIYKNPIDFSANLNNILLFNTLKAKGDCFKAMYQQKKTSKMYFTAALDTYESAAKLSSFLLNLYDNEEARLNLTEQIYPFFSNYVDLLLEGYHQFQDPILLEKAFILAEKSKSSVLSINLNESDLKSRNKIPDSLRLKEQFLSLTKSKLLLNTNFNQQQNPAIAQQINDVEISLSRLRNSINQKLTKSETDENEIWNLAILKSKFLKDDRAIMTIFKINENYHAFLLTKSAIKTHLVGNSKKIDFLIDILNDKISNSLYGKTYTGETQERVIYDMFFKSFEDDLKEVSKLIIIPHFETVRLPFEVLKNQENKYLVSKFEILYQYSADILLQSEEQKLNLEKILAAAPFVDAHSGNVLPASLKEIEAIDGQKQISRQATKQDFFATYKNHSIIHLATHATANNTLPAKSYVSFYPKQKDSLQNRMYIDEIKLLDFRNVDLLFLSACETSTGKQIQNEGIMSLSRAFSLAGCTNIITSLWKAEDEATAYLSTKFYQYLSNNHSIESALQRAKLDLLNNPKMIQYHSPAYWSHLIMIGVPQKKSYFSWYLGLAFATLIGAVTLIYLKFPFFSKNLLPSQLSYRIRYFRKSSKK